VGICPYKEREKLGLTKRKVINPPILRTEKGAQPATAAQKKKRKRCSFEREGGAVHEKGKEGTTWRNPKRKKKNEFSTGCERRGKNHRRGAAGQHSSTEKDQDGKGKPETRREKRRKTTPTEDEKRKGRGKSVGACEVGERGKEERKESRFFLQLRREIGAWRPQSPKGRGEKLWNAKRKRR